MDAGSHVITFARTLDAFAFEDAARESGFPGRIIPLPTGIAATCGLAWLIPSGDKDLVSSLDRLPKREGAYRYDGTRYQRLG